MNSFKFTSLPINKAFSGILERLEPAPGFAVKLGDMPTAEMKLVESMVKSASDGTCHVSSIFHLAGIEIETRHTVFPEGNALSFSGSIRNTLDKPSPAIHALLPFCQGLSLKREERVFAYTFTGGRGDCAYPPLDFSFHAKKHELVAWLANHHSTTWADGGMTWNGFSSAREIPYQIVQFGKDAGGVFFALEWPGDWNASVARGSGGRTLMCQTGLCSLDLILNPGESIPMPGALVGFYNGDWIEGCNALRRTIVNHYVPKLDGKTIVPPVFYDHWFALNQDCTEPLMREQSAYASGIGCEYFVQDAGWYKGSPLREGCHFHGTGNCDNVQSEKYPNGLKPLSDCVLEKGMGFGLWVEPTRCDAESDLAKAHPDWIVFAKDKSRFNNLVNFGNPEALNWFIKTFDKLVRDNNVRWFRFDTGAGCEDYPEPPRRKGILKIRHYEGLMRFWDHLLHEHPALLFEGCSNGGRRMDLSSIKRSHTFWCNDHTQHPDIVRSDMRINLIFPANYLNHVLCLQNNDADYHHYAYHCLMGGTWGFTEKLSEWSEKRINDAKRHVDVFKKFRHLLMKNFAPLFPYPYTLEDWDGFQWHDPETGEGVIIIFRCLGDEVDCSPKLRWLDAGRQYEFTDPYTGNRRFISGAKLVNDGLPVKLTEHRSSLVLTYQ
jgi:alpha-galactosidase